MSNQFECESFKNKITEFEYHLFGVYLYYESIPKIFKWTQKSSYESITQRGSLALKKAKQLIGKKNADKTEIEIKSDSQLIVSQLNGEFKLKEENLWKYFIEIWNLKQAFKRIFFSYVPREKNRIADTILNETLNSHARKGLF